MLETAWLMYVIEGCTHAGNARVHEDHEDIVAFLVADDTAMPALRLLIAAA